MPYATRTNIENIFGTDNVRIWADIDNTDDAAFITTRVNWALEAAEAEMDILLGGRGYVIPVVADPIPIILRDMTAKLAAIKLYESRGVKDWDAATGRPQHALMWHQKQVNDWLTGFRAGLISIPGLDKTTTNAPGVVRDDEYVVYKITENYPYSPWFSV